MQKAATTDPIPYNLIKDHEIQVGQRIESQLGALGTIIEIVYIQDEDNPDYRDDVIIEWSNGMKSKPLRCWLGKDSK
jgi:hypothetical protein